MDITLPVEMRNVKLSHKSKNLLYLHECLITEVVLTFSLIPHVPSQNDGGSIAKSNPVHCPNEAVNINEQIDITK